MALSIENEVIAGSGTAPHLRGITATAGIVSAPTPPRRLDTSRGPSKALEAANPTAPESRSTRGLVADEDVA